METKDEKFVVVENGQKVTGPLKQTEAETEAKRRNQLAESQGKTVKEGQGAQVKQVLLG